MLQSIFNLQYHASALASARAEQEHTAQDLVRLIDTANAPIIGIDAHGLINEWNQTAARLTGYSKYEVMGQDLVERFISDESRLSVQRVLKKALEGEDTANYEIPLRTKHGDTIHLLLNATTRRSRDDAIEGVIGIGQDITERLEQESQLRQRVKLEALGGLTGGIAHDFNNILTGMTVSAQLLLGSDGLAQKHRDDIHDIKGAAERATRLTRQLMAFSRTQVISPEVLVVNDVVSSFERMLSRLIGEDVRMRFIAADAPLAIEVDPIQLVLTEIK